MPNNNLLRQTIGLEKIASSIIFDRSIIIKGLSLLSLMSVRKESLI